VNEIYRNHSIVKITLKLKSNLSYIISFIFLF